MGEAATIPLEAPEKSKGEDSARKKIERTYTAELVIGICAPIGSLVEPVIEALKNRLGQKKEKDNEPKYEYEVIPIKLSKFITDAVTFKNATIKNHTKEFAEKINKINGGNFLRKKFKNNAILAEIVISEINRQRTEYFREKLGRQPEITDITSRRVCYIIDSLKNPEELELLRMAYQDLFYQFSIFSPRKERIECLNKKDLSNSEIAKIIDTDEFDNDDHGQNVRETFVDGDFFIRASKESLEDIQSKVDRYLHLIFGSEVITPLNHETAMYAAKSAAGNSACLSRQVGATITNKGGEIISTGWNDVPKFGGNLYRDSDEHDDRCKLKGFCSNDSTKDTLTHDIIEKIKEDEKLNKLIPISENHNFAPFMERLKTIVRKSTKVKDLIEFSRSVHAEMHAIIVGSQLSADKMVGGKLFCTTYPCHNCARHIIAAGIEEVYYIEPYVKSLCIDLHKDAITEVEDETNKVKILLYDGVAPRKYLDFFSMTEPRKDKNTGKKTVVDMVTIFPKSRITLQAIPTLEQQAIHSLSKAGFKFTEKYEEEEE